MLRSSGSCPLYARGLRSARVWASPERPIPCSAVDLQFFSWFFRSCFEPGGCAVAVILPSARCVPRARVSASSCFGWTWFCFPQRRVISVRHFCVTLPHTWLYSCCRAPASRASWPRCLIHQYQPWLLSTAKFFLSGCVWCGSEFVGSLAWIVTRVCSGVDLESPVQKTQGFLV
jgi:hypothetical protein